MLDQRMTDHLAAVMVDYGHRFAAKFLAEGERRQTTGAEPSSRGLIQGKILVNRGYVPSDLSDDYQSFQEELIHAEQSGYMACYQPGL